MAVKPVDRRIQRTRSLLHQALMQLLVEKDYDAITVQDLIDRADVGRSTFYAHFLDKRDLLESRIEELRQELAQMLHSHRELTDDPVSRVLGFSLAMLVHARAHHGIYRAIVGKPSGAMVQDQIQTVLRGLVHEALAAELAGSHATYPPREVMVLSTVSTFMAVLSWWLDQADPIPAEEVARMIRTVLEPGLLQVLRPSGNPGV